MSLRIMNLGKLGSFCLSSTYIGNPFGLVLVSSKFICYLNSFFSIDENLPHFVDCFQTRPHTPGGFSFELNQVARIKLPLSQIRWYQVVLQSNKHYASFCLNPLQYNFLPTDCASAAASIWTGYQRTAAAQSAAIDVPQAHLLRCTRQLQASWIHGLEASRSRKPNENVRFPKSAAQPLQRVSPVPSVACEEVAVPTVRHALPRHSRMALS